MSITLSKGYKKPEIGDREFYTDLEDNIDRINDHNHDGVNSQLLNIEDFVKKTSTVLAAAWGSDLGGSTYRQTITMPLPLEFDTSTIFVRTSTGSVIYPTILKTGTSAFSVTVNDNTLELVITYV